MKIAPHSRVEVLLHLSRERRSLHQESLDSFAPAGYKTRVCTRPEALLQCRKHRTHAWICAEAAAAAAPVRMRQYCRGTHHHHLFIFATTQSNAPSKIDG